MKLTIIFSEWNSELGLNAVIGQKYLGEIEETKAHLEAKRILDVLSEIKQEKVSYLLQTEHKNILISI